MISFILFFAYYALLLVFGIQMSFSFSGIRSHKGNKLVGLGTFLVSGLLQLILYFACGEDLLWKIYPLLSHLPVLLLLLLVYRKRFITSIAAITTVYLYCQPSRWFGELFLTLTGSDIAEHIARLVSLLLVILLSITYLSRVSAELYNQKTSSVFLVSALPIFYYIFNYATRIYSDLWERHTQLTSEFILFLVSIMEMLFCVIYYTKDIQQTRAQQKENIIRITLEQQSREMEAIRRNEQEIRLLRHDMRLFLSNISVCLDAEDIPSAQKIISGFTSYIDSTVVQHYCSNATVNYILSDYAARCSAEEVEFAANVNLNELPADEIIFSSILSNALDNALNAQLELPREKRRIKVLLKFSNGKILLSTENPFRTAPVFIDGLPVSRKRNHGFGTQSIRYAVERLGGNCQFTVLDDQFVFRAVI